MQKKEYYKHNLPHFQQPGQAYFVTWSLIDAVPKHKLKYFSIQLEKINSQLSPDLAVSNPRLNSGELAPARPGDDAQSKKLKKEYLISKKKLNNGL